MISGLDDGQVCQLLAYSNSAYTGESLDNIIIHALNGEGRDIAVRVAALLGAVQNHVPSPELIAKLTETINSNDLPRALAGVSLAKRLLFSVDEFSLFLETLWPQRVVWF